MALREARHRRNLFRPWDAAAAAASSAAAASAASSTIKAMPQEDSLSGSDSELFVDNVIKQNRPSPSPSQPHASHLKPRNSYGASTSRLSSSSDIRLKTSCGDTAFQRQAPMMDPFLRESLLASGYPSNFNPITAHPHSFQRPQANPFANGYGFHDATSLMACDPTQSLLNSVFPGESASFLEAASAAMSRSWKMQQKKQRPKRFQCPHCQVSFSNNGQLKGHIRIHTGKSKWLRSNCLFVF